MQKRCQYSNIESVTIKLSVICAHLQRACLRENIFLIQLCTYTMMLLIGMWMSFTKKPMKPIMQNPMAVAMAIFWNSEKRCIKFYLVSKYKFNE